MAEPVLNIEVENAISSEDSVSRIEADAAILDAGLKLNALADARRIDIMRRLANTVRGDIH